MAIKYHAVSISSDIVEDDFEDGEGESTGCGYRNEPIGKTFGTLADMIAFLATTFGLSLNPVDYDIEADTLETSRMVANHTEAQNGGWFDPTKGELARWKRGAMKLYSENISVRFLRCI